MVRSTENVVSTLQTKTHGKLLRMADQANQGLAVFCYADVEPSRPGHDVEASEPSDLLAEEGSEDGGDDRTDSHLRYPLGIWRNGRTPALPYTDLWDEDDKSIDDRV